MLPHSSADKLVYLFIVFLKEWTAGAKVMELVMRSLGIVQKSYDTETSFKTRKTKDKV